jgi:Fe-S cluster biogenesis protein NfuA
MAEPKELSRKLERVEKLVTGLEACPDPDIRDQTRELVATLMDFHGAALARAVEILEGHVPDAKETMAAIGQDPVAGGLLLMYGLHPDDLETRVNRALEQVRPDLAAHKGDVELLGIEGSTVHLRLKGTCNGCPSSTTTFRNLIEGAIHDRAPEIDDIQVEGLTIR